MLERFSCPSWNGFWERLLTQHLPFRPTNVSLAYLRLTFLTAIARLAYLVARDRSPTVAGQLLCPGPGCSRPPTDRMTVVATTKTATPTAISTSTAHRRIPRHRPRTVQSGKDRPAVVAVLWLCTDRPDSLGASTGDCRDPRSRSKLRRLMSAKGPLSGSLRPKAPPRERTQGEGLTGKGEAMAEKRYSVPRAG